MFHSLVWGAFFRSSAQFMLQVCANIVQSQFSFSQFYGNDSCNIARYNGLTPKYIATCLPFILSLSLSRSIQLINKNDRKHFKLYSKYVVSAVFVNGLKSFMYYHNIFLTFCYKNNHIHRAHLTAR